MESNSNTSIKSQLDNKAINISYQSYLQQQHYGQQKQMKDRLDTFKQKLIYQNYFEENDDVNIIYPSTK